MFFRADQHCLTAGRRVSSQQSGLAQFGDKDLTRTECWQKFCGSTEIWEARTKRIEQATDGSSLLGAVTTTNVGPIFRDSHSRYGIFVKKLVVFVIQTSPAFSTLAAHIQMEG
jgi:hypothetical protein